MCVVDTFVRNKDGPLELKRMEKRKYDHEFVKIISRVGERIDSDSRNIEINGVDRGPESMSHSGDTVNSELPPLR